MELLVLLVIGYFIYRLRKDVRRLERRLDEVAPVSAPSPGVETPGASPEPSAETDSPWTGAPVPPKASPASPPRPPRISWMSRLISALEVPDRVREVIAGLVANWALVVAGVSLALGGIFMVQYGVEAGLLGPRMRVIGAALVGVALIAAGERIRRRFGDETEGPTAAIPSTLSGAGLVSLFAAPVAAHALYDLIGPVTALIATSAVSGAAILLGWFHGRALVIGGVIGASISPLLVDGDPGVSGLLLYHQALIALAGVSIGAIRGWTGVMALSLALPAWMGWVIYVNVPTPGHMSIFALAIAALAVWVPGRSRLPAHDGPTLSGTFLAGSDWPHPATLFAGAGVIFAAVTLTLVGSEAGVTGLLQAAAATAAGAIIMIGFAPRAPALADLFAPFAIALVAMLVGQGLVHGSAISVTGVVDETSIINSLEKTSEAAGFPLPAPILFLGASLGIALFLLATYAPRPRLALSTPMWSALVPGLPVATAFALQAYWDPGLILGRYNWALLVIGAAAALTMAARFASRQESGPGPVTGQIAAGAAVLIAQALFIMLSHSVLTVALGGLLVALAVTDRVYRLRGFGLLIQAGTVLIGGRFIYDAFSAQLIFHADAFTALAVQLPPVLCLVAACWLMDRGRTATRVTLESGAWGMGALAACTQVFHLVGEGAPHVSFGLFALSALIPGLVQLYRLQISDGVMWWVRLILSGFFLSIGVILLCIREILFTPLAEGFLQHDVSGPFLFDTLAAGYLTVAVLLAVASRLLVDLPKWIRSVFLVISGAHVAAYTGFEIRRFWRGNDLSVAGVTQPELYSYTIAMMLAAAGLLLLAYLRGSDRLRRLAMAAAAVTIVKVFLVDMEGLTGLIRVASFIGLGLALAGLAWVNRVIRGLKG